ncbi:amidohydrolase family protein [Nocardioides sp. Bht2]|uniref:amidohydrolase family protein n=1 Tax=Nocardioides sp. Bht2 TaxID=3392297 RepID=UPI0039B44308
MRIIDTHTRLVDVTGAQWRANREEILARHSEHAQQCTPAECGYAGHRDGAVDSFVHVSSTVERELCLAEVDWVERIARLHDLDLVMIAGVDPDRSGAEILADLEVFAGSESFRGVRLPLGMPSDLPFVENLLHWLAERSLVVEFSPTADQVPAWVTALEKHPHLVSVVGYDTWVIPPQARVEDDWRDAFRAYADGNVDAWQVTLPRDEQTAVVSPEIIRPWLELGVETLGWDRLMFASTLSLDTSATQYPTLIAEFEKLLDFAPEEDRAKFWSDNAAAAYRM